MGLLDDALSWIDARKRYIANTAQDIYNDPAQGLGLLGTRALDTLKQGAGNQLDAASQYFAPGATPQSQQDAIGQVLGGPAGLLGMTVYHGSPHLFDKFDMSKIGTGEGAQAYGHGLYFAENPEVAGSYKRAGMNPRDAIRTMTMDPSLSDAAAAFKASGLGEDALYASMRKQFPSTSASEIHDAITLPKPNLYKVDIPDEHIANMLDWDKPLSQQPQSVQKALSDLPLPGNATGQQIHNAVASRAVSSLDPSMRGMAGADQVAAAEALRARGIPGIKYYDQGSRAGPPMNRTPGVPYGQRTHNYVLFDDSLANILGRE